MTLRRSSRYTPVVVVAHRVPHLKAALAGMFGLLLTTGAAAAAPERTLQIRLSPVVDVAAPDTIATLNVVLRFDGTSVPAGVPLVTLPHLVTNVDTAATAIGGLVAADDGGSLPLIARQTERKGPADGGTYTEWTADRATNGAVTLRYAVPARAVLPPRGPAPPLSFSNDAGGVSAAGTMFVLLPPGEARYRTTVTWDLTSAPAGSRGVSSLGEGQVTATQPLSASQIGSTYFMAGRIGIAPDQGPAGGFFGAWQGTPPFDAAGLLGWAGSLYGHYTRLFGQKDGPPFGVFLRNNPVNAGGGVGLNRSFVITFGKGDGADIDKLKVVLAHEMFHTFQPYLKPGVLENAWFGEGLAVFYAARLSLRYRLITPDDFLKDVNAAAGRYYTSAMAAVPNSEIAKRFWADTRIRTLPYDRGMLYFVTVDAALRKASGGKRSLDDLMLAMLALQRDGRSIGNADWEALLLKDLGQGAVNDFHAVLTGRMPVPASHAFGVCFRRTVKPLRRYELGFDPAVLAEPRRVVRGLVAGSAAAAAGLRNGDEIVVPVPQDNIQGDQDARLMLTIRRAGSELPITYLPRGETVAAYQWVRAGRTYPADCGL